MNNFSFLDTASSNGPMPRAAPSPTPQSPQPNGGQFPQSNGGSVGAGGGGGGQQQNGIPMVNGLPSGGQQTDMNYLWSVVQQLSQMLEENRAQTLGIVNGVQAIQQRASEEGVPVGGLGVREVNGELNASQHAEITDLQSQLTTARTRISELGTSNTQLTALLTSYENAVTLLLEKLRPYAYNQTTTLLSLHKHYQTLLEAERNTSMQLRLEHAEWQAGLGRVAEYARNALEAEGEGERGFRAEVKGLREENRVLRRMVGWEERADGSSDEEEPLNEEEQALGRGR